MLSHDFIKGLARELVIDLGADRAFGKASQQLGNADVSPWGMHAPAGWGPSAYAVSGGLQ